MGAESILADSDGFTDGFLRGAAELTDRELLAFVMERLDSIERKLNLVLDESRNVSAFVDAMRPLLETYGAMGEQISKGGFAALGALFSRGSG